MYFFEFEKPLFPVYAIIGSSSIQRAYQAYHEDISGEDVNYAVPQMVPTDYALKKYLAAVDPMNSKKKKGDVKKEFEDLMEHYPVFLVVADRFI